VRDADRFDEFYRGTCVRVLQYLYAAGGDLGEAQDAAQEGPVGAAVVHGRGSPQCEARGRSLKIRMPRYLFIHACLCG
jgi:hypothetical protein